MNNAAISFNKMLAVHLAVRRHESDLSMRSVAEIINKPHSFVGKIEKLSRRLDVGEFVSYCRAIGLDPLQELAVLIKDFDQSQLPTDQHHGAQPL